MARYQPTIDIHKLDQRDRAKLQPGQWVRAGENGPTGRFYGSGSSDVVAWLGNARSWRKSKGGVPGYFRIIAEYGRGVRSRANA